MLNNILSAEKTIKISWSRAIKKTIYDFGLEKKNFNEYISIRKSRWKKITSNRYEFKYKTGTWQAPIMLQGLNNEMENIFTGKMKLIHQMNNKSMLKSR